VQQALWLINKITEYLSADKNRLVVFENVCAKPTSPWIQKTNIKIHAFKEEVYHALGSGYVNDKQHIEKTLKHTKSVFLFVGVMSYLSDKECVLPKQLDIDIIRDIAKNTKAIILEAFDGEGYIICTF
jgi:GTP:adenosylcobinamide-phosphate guanylyltransferase